MQLKGNDRYQFQLICLENMVSRCRRTPSCGNAPTGLAPHDLSPIYTELYLLLIYSQTLLKQTILKTKWFGKLIFYKPMVLRICRWRNGLIFPKPFRNRYN